MAKLYNHDLRMHILQVVENGNPQRVVRVELNLGSASIRAQYKNDLEVNTNFEFHGMDDTNLKMRTRSSWVEWTDSLVHSGCGSEQCKPRKQSGPCPCSSS